MVVEEKYSVDIEERVEVNGEPAEKLNSLYMAGDFNYDVIYGWGYKLGKCITENYFTSWNGQAFCSTIRS